jgi:hypothetical protein
MAGSSPVEKVEPQEPCQRQTASAQAIRSASCRGRLESRRRGQLSLPQKVKAHARSGLKPPTVASVATVAVVCESEGALIGFAPSLDVAVGKSADAAGISPAVVFEVERRAVPGANPIGLTTKAESRNLSVL